MKPFKISVICCLMILVFFVSGCQTGDQNAVTNGGQDTPSQNGQSIYVPGEGEKILYQDERVCYIVKDEEIENEGVDKAAGDYPETQSYLYKANADGSNKELIFEAPQHNYYFRFDIATEDWLYLDISGGDISGEGYPIGIARIDRKTNEFSIITNQLNASDNPSAYGLEVFEGKGYFFLFGHNVENEDISGIYELNLKTSVIKMVGVLPDNFTAWYSMGNIYGLKNDLLYFAWDDVDEDLAGEYILVIKTGNIEKISDEIDYINYPNFK